MKPLEIKDVISGAIGRKAEEDYITFDVINVRSTNLKYGRSYKVEIWDKLISYSQAKNVADALSYFEFSEIEITDKTGYCSGEDINIIQINFKKEDPIPYKINLKTS